MAHEGDIEPALGLKQILSHFKVFVGYVDPISDFVYCHIRCRFVVYGGKDKHFLSIILHFPR
jgi:hypothetical protein